MRSIVLDTETTGLNPESGDRIVEIGAVELSNMLPTGRTYQCYINPEKPMPPSAQAVHGLSDEFLADKPVFAEIADAFLQFVDGAPLVIHNAVFDVRFLDTELKRLGYPLINKDTVVDTLRLAQQKFPGAAASLDVLCQRFSISTEKRQVHGALLDAELLAAVYLELQGGKQLGLGAIHGLLDQSSKTKTLVEQPVARPRGQALAWLLTNDEAKAHADFIRTLGGTGNKKALWLTNGQKAGQRPQSG